MEIYLFLADFRIIKEDLDMVGKRQTKNTKAEIIQNKCGE